ncbi:acyltransferase Pun1-like [Solanum stenotomum]|uniref:acyltransferase Pun1-like n=1 Tax=Solanum stenotomum TaxID=172797 RepID=UPI0020D1D1AA|nr:acyltransferase Pun1-like [Solanum stenotomum]
MNAFRTLATIVGGSLKNNATIECDDHGAEFFKVEINSSMDKAINHPDLTFLQGLSCRDSSSSTFGPLTLAQLSHFECGEVALSFCMLHKVGDACSAYYFLRDWARLTRDPKSTLSPPYFAMDSLMPSPFDGPMVSPVVEPKMEGCIHQRFIFSESKINALKVLVVAESCWLSGRIEKLPHLFPNSITMMVLSFSGLTEDPMPILEMLPNLRNLDLFRAYEGKEIISDNNFSQLEFLHLTELEKLKRWLLGTNVMPLIKGLGIHNCPNLKEIPQRMKDVELLKRNYNKW